MRCALKDEEGIKERVTLKKHRSSSRLLFVAVTSTSPFRFFFLLTQKEWSHTQSPRLFTGLRERSDERTSTLYLELQLSPSTPAQPVVVVVAWQRAICISVTFQRLTTSVIYTSLLAFTMVLVTRSSADNGRCPRCAPRESRRVFCLLG